VRLDEFIHSPKNTPESNLLTALELIQHRYKDKEKVPNVSTQSLINLVRNTDRTFDYEALAQANETNPAVKNLIKSFNKDVIELNPIQPAEDDAKTTTNVGDTTTDAPVDTVSNMATRAAKKRDADIF
jgi:hypothetical protein